MAEGCMLSPRARASAPEKAAVHGAYDGCVSSSQNAHLRVSATHHQTSKNVVYTRRGRRWAERWACMCNPFRKPQYRAAYDTYPLGRVLKERLSVDQARSLAREVARRSGHAVEVSRLLVYPIFFLQIPILKPKNGVLIMTMTASGVYAYQHPAQKTPIVKFAPLFKNS
jgi:hypothetical protein